MTHSRRRGPTIGSKMESPGSGARWGIWGRPHAHLTPPGSIGRVDVLIIDDDPAVRRAVGKALERAGYGVETVDTGLAAMAAVRAHSFHAIVCDVRMPFLDGVTFYDELEKADPEAAKRVVFVTAFATDPTVQAFLERIDRPVVEKPFELDDLLAVVKASSR